MTTRPSDPANNLHIDIETYSEVNLSKVGVYRYAAHPSTKILCIAWYVDNCLDEPVYLWDACGMAEKTDEFVTAGLPDLLEWMHDDSCRFHAWNAMFERVMLDPKFSSAARSLSLPSMPRNRWRCTMALAGAAGLPQSLLHCAKAFGTHQKDEVGRGEMLQLSKPRPETMREPDMFGEIPAGWDPEEYPDKYQRLYEYCASDVLAEHGIWTDLPPMPESEEQTYIVDQEINDNGIEVDVEFARRAAEATLARKDELAQQCKNLCGYPPGSVEAIRVWANDNGSYLPNMRAETIRDYLDHDKKLNGDVKAALETYSEWNQKAPMKFQTVLDSHVGGRVRGMFRFYGASTGRWSSNIIQLQNLKRPVINPDDVVIAVKRGEFDAEWLQFSYGERPLNILGSCVRSSLIAAEGNLLIVRDYSQIEARVLAWLARHDSLLEVFRRGDDVYRFAAAGIFKKDILDVTDKERFVGKTATLALGYQGGVNAFLRMAKNFGAEMDPGFAQHIVKAWRLANAPIRKFWRRLEDGARAVLTDRNRDFDVVPGLTFYKDKLLRDSSATWLSLRLPSGRCLRYYMPKISLDGKIEYSGVDSVTRRFGRTQTYGGRLAENAASAVARDLLAGAMRELHASDVTLVGSVHDELIAEAPEREAKGTSELMEEVMGRVPIWAVGLPVASDGSIMKRYGK